MLLIQQTDKLNIAGTRMFWAGGGALVVTLALFAAMQQLIAVKASGPRLQTTTPVVALYEPVKETDPQVKQPLPQKPEVKPRNLPRISPEPVETVLVSPHGFSIAAPVLAKTSGRAELAHTDRTAAPLVRTEPRYPVDAARDGISGWVKLGFSIDETGAVTDIEVLAAEPARTFNREAIAALKRWKYQAKLVDGVAIKQTGLQVQLDFSLDNN